MNKITWGEPIYIADNNGDTWDPTWAADDNLYCASNDTDGFGKVGSRNVMFNVISGDDPTKTQGKTVNTMDEYGIHAEKLDDNCTWKTCGTLSQNGILYQGIGRHCYGHESGDLYKRQTTVAASIIKSTDMGKTWVPSVEEIYKKPHFSDYFTTPYFIHYGKDGDTSATPEEHGADKYIYAISNNGFWDSGDFYILGRVAKEKLENLNPSDWEYLIDKDGNTPIWGSDPSKAYKIIEQERGCGESGATYIPALGKYILIAWHYTENGRDKTYETVFDVYMADTPWDNWKHVGTKLNNPEGWYCPRVISKFQTSCDGKVRLYVCTSGDYNTGYGQAEFNYYRLTFIPMDIE